MLEAKTPIGRIQIPKWEEKKLIDLTDEELLQRAIAENKNICVSPATYAMIEKRFLGRTLQQMINPNLGMRHDTLALTYNW